MNFIQYILSAGGKRVNLIKWNLQVYNHLKGMTFDNIILSNVGHP